MNKNIIPIKIVFNKKKNEYKKPIWIKKKFPINLYEKIKNIKKILKEENLNSVCEEASCPNINDCFSRGIATFIILGNICTRKCVFCNIKKGRPNAPDENEPKNISKAIKRMNLNYVVITSVNRDDLHDGGAYHFYKCIKEIRKINNKIIIEILVPDFRNCENKALKIIKKSLPNVFNHNIENVPRLYKYIRPGANYKKSLNLLNLFKVNNKNIPTKSGIMLGLGENNKEVYKVFNDLYNVGVDILTVGQYLRPSLNHAPVKRYVNIDEFNEIKNKAMSIGFKYVYSGPFVRSSFNADINYKKLFCNK